MGLLIAGVGGQQLHKVQREVLKAICQSVSQRGPVSTVALSFPAVPFHSPHPQPPIRESLPELTIPPAGNNLIIIVQWLGRSRQYRAQVALGCRQIHGRCCET